MKMLSLTFLAQDGVWTWASLTGLDPSLSLGWSCGCMVIGGFSLLCTINLEARLFLDCLQSGCIPFPPDLQFMLPLWRGD